jgi:ADP-ribose pyrophosphatase YjhB (NUDIX family)
MKKYTLNLELNKPIANLYRGRHVLVACMDKQGNILLGDKPDLYPKGITRLIGGGLEKGEDPRAGAVREVREEMGIVKKTGDLEDLCEITIKAKVGADRYKLVNYLFVLEVDPKKIKEGDDVGGVSVMTLEQLGELADRFEALPDTMMFHHKSGYSHSWGDYGRVYGPVHRIVYEELKTRMKA